MKIKQQNATAIFEVDDSGRERETSAGASYSSSFRAFLAMLGFEVKPVGLGVTYSKENVNINGVLMELNYESASLMSTNAYQRDIRLRAKRHVTISCSGNDIHVPINKEFDSTKLKTRILEKIEERKNSYDRQMETMFQRARVPRKLINHLLNNEYLAKHIDGLYIDRHEFSVSIKYGHIVFDLDKWTFKKFNCNTLKTETFEDLTKLQNIVVDMSEVVKVTSIMMEKTGHGLDLEELDILKKTYSLNIKREVTSYEKEGEYFLYKMYRNIEDLAREINYGNEDTDDITSKNREYAESKGYGSYHDDVFNAAMRLPQIVKKVNAFAKTL